MLGEVEALHRVAGAQPGEGGAPSALTAVIGHGATVATTDHGDCETSRIRTIPWLGGLAPFTCGHVAGPVWLRAPKSSRVLNAPRGRGKSPELTQRADVAQLVEHHLAKVRVAGSSPVVRSEERILVAPGPVGTSLKVEWPRGEAAACKAVYTGSNPVSTSQQSDAPHPWAIGAAVARFPDTEEVTGSIPVSPTSFITRGASRYREAPLVFPRGRRRCGRRGDRVTGRARGASGGRQVHRRAETDHDPPATDPDGFELSTSPTLQP